MTKRDLDYKLRDGAEYRRERLEAEHERLERRLSWATHRKDRKEIQRLERHIDALENNLEDSLAPGRPTNRFDMF